MEKKQKRNPKQSLEAHDLEISWRVLCLCFACDVAVKSKHPIPSFVFVLSLYFFLIFLWASSLYYLFLASLSYCPCCVEIFLHLFSSYRCSASLRISALRTLKAHRCAEIWPNLGGAPAVSFFGWVTLVECVDLRSEMESRFVKQTQQPVLMLVSSNLQVFGCSLWMQKIYIYDSKSSHLNYPLKINVICFGITSDAWEPNLIQGDKPDKACPKLGGKCWSFQVCVGGCICIYKYIPICIYTNHTNIQISNAWCGPEGGDLCHRLNKRNAHQQVFYLDNRKLWINGTWA